MKGSCEDGLIPHFNGTIDLLYSDHPAISVVVSNSEARLAGSQDGALLDVYVNNRLPCVSMTYL